MFYEAAAEIAAGVLRKALLERLSKYMVPSVFIFLSGLPLNANGKIDRHALSGRVRNPS